MRQSPDDDERTSVPRTDRIRTLDRSVVPRSLSTPRLSRTPSVSLSSSLFPHPTAPRPRRSSRVSGGLSDSPTSRARPRVLSRPRPTSRAFSDHPTHTDDLLLYQKTRPEPPAARQPRVRVEEKHILLLVLPFRGRSERGLRVGPGAEAFARALGIVPASMRGGWIGIRVGVGVGVAFALALALAFASVFALAPPESFAAVKMLLGLTRASGESDALAKDPRRSSRSPVGEPIPPRVHPSAPADDTRGCLCSCAFKGGGVTAMCPDSAAAAECRARRCVPTPPPCGSDGVPGDGAASSMNSEDAVVLPAAARVPAMSKYTSGGLGGERFGGESTSKSSARRCAKASSGRSARAKRRKSASAAAAAAASTAAAREAEL